MFSTNDVNLTRLDYNLSTQNVGISSVCVLLAATHDKNTIKRKIMRKKEKDSRMKK